MTQRTFLRAKLHPLHVTSVEATADSFPGAIHLCPRLCWAAGLAELEQVEVTSLANGACILATLLIGGAGEARLPEGDTIGFEPGDGIVVTVRVPVPTEKILEHTATIVLADPRRNAAIEIRRQEVRHVLLEPSFTPPPLRREESVTLPSTWP